MRVKAGIAGAAGYAGGELLRLLLSHPAVDVAAATSSTFPGKPLRSVHPHLRGRGSDLAFSRTLDPKNLDVLFFAGSHGEAMRSLPGYLSQAGPNLKVIDLSADFRLKEPSLYPIWYGREHSAKEMLNDFTYGLSELNRENIKKASRVANPGCFATALSLALGPLARAGFTGPAHATALTGSSGSGAAPSAATHHPARDGSMKAYKALKHQHVPEVEQLFDALAGKKSMRIALTPVSGPFVRGIYAVCQMELTEGFTQERVLDLYAAAYAAANFITLTPEPPDLKTLAGTNHCDIHLAFSGTTFSVIAALDNLVKGAAGQAVQNMNLMLNFEETAGLLASGVYP